MRRTPDRLALWLLLLFAASETALAEPVDFSVPLLGGGEFALHDHRGAKPVLLKFWATWCAACVKEMPAYRALHARLKDRVAFLAVNVGVSDPLERVRTAIIDHALTMPVTYDASGALWKQFGVIGTPMYVLIDRQGNVAYTSHRHDERLERAVEEAIDNGTMLTPIAAPVMTTRLTDIDGKPVEFSRGETIVAYHFATWCESYLRESYAALSTQCRDFREGIARLAALDLPRTRFIGFATRYSSDVQSVRAYRERNGITHPLVFDTAGVFAERFGVRDFPHVVVIRDGVTIHSANSVNDTLVRILDTRH